MTSAPLVNKSNSQYSVRTSSCKSEGATISDPLPWLEEATRRRHNNPALWRRRPPDIGTMAHLVREEKPKDVEGLTEGAIVSAEWWPRNTNCRQVLVFCNPGYVWQVFINGVLRFWVTYCIISNETLVLTMITCLGWTPTVTWERWCHSWGLSPVFFRWDQCSFSKNSRRLLKSPKSRSSLWTMHPRVVVILPMGVPSATPPTLTATQTTATMVARSVARVKAPREAIPGQQAKIRGWVPSPSGRTPPLVFSAHTQVLHAVLPWLPSHLLAPILVLAYLIIAATQPLGLPAVATHPPATATSSPVLFHHHLHPL